jgi:pSer/pThr/pTyr-binding forkhead associated (FHA) protein
MKSARVVIIPHGNLQGKEYVFEAPTRCIIGRADDCDIRLPGDYWHSDISRHHCVLEIDPPAIRVRDLGSRNGTYVNGQKIGQRPPQQTAEAADSRMFADRELKEGDEVQVGREVFRIGIAACSEGLQPVADPAYFP